MRAGIRLVFCVGTQYLQQKSFAWIWFCTESDPSRGLLPLKTVGRALKEVVSKISLDTSEWPTVTGQACQLPGAGRRRSHTGGSCMSVEPTEGREQAVSQSCPAGCVPSWEVARDSAAVSSFLLSDIPAHVPQTPRAFPTSLYGFQ